MWSHDSDKDFYISNIIEIDKIIKFFLILKKHGNKYK